ncbi:MAG: transglutaminase domain-containing protein [Ilumatobacteraceae bacterium]
MSSGTLEYYATPGRFTTIDDAWQTADIAAVIAAVQGALIYDLAAQSLYGVELAPAQAEAIHERDTARLLAQLRRIDDRPLGADRPVANRVGARCQAYSRVTVALLRAAGVPARARCGFAAYFVPDRLEDHWVAEYWQADAQCWRMVDAQLDAAWQSWVGAGVDPLAITSDQFVTAGHAWQAWRRGELDAERCGLSSAGEHGSFWIAGNLRLDLAALNEIEMLPWDVWGDGWGPGEEPDDEQLRRFDEVAELTVDPDARFDEMRTRYQSDDALRMDGTVFNALRQRVETVDGP